MAASFPVYGASSSDGFSATRFVAAPPAPDSALSGGPSLLPPRRARLSAAAFAGIFLALELVSETLIALVDLRDTDERLVGSGSGLRL